MWRLYVRKEYLNNVISMGKFFLNRRFKFNYGDMLLLLLTKKDDPKHLGRIRGLLLFDKMVNDDGESLLIYGRKWRYKLIASKSIMFAPRDWFDLEDVLGIDARRYYCQVEAMKIDDSDMEPIMSRLLKYKYIK